MLAPRVWNIKWAAAAWLALCLALGGCATSTEVSSDSGFKPDQGLLLVRVIDVGRVPITRLTVVSETTGEQYWLTPIRFGQMFSRTYVGVLPKGRYRPLELRGSMPSGMGIQTITVPLTTVTGRFDIEPGRATQLGTMVFTRLPGPRFDLKVERYHASWRSPFALPLDPTPVPVDALLAARFPQLAQTARGKPPLGWVENTLPQWSFQRFIGDARAHAVVKNNPTFTDANTVAAGGPLGVIAVKRAGLPVVRQTADTLHAVTALLGLQDGRWLLGGEEGYLALSANEGKTWQALAPRSPEEVVLHLAQRPDGRLLMVTDNDQGAVVYESADNPIAWKEIKRLPSEREQGFWTKQIGENPEFRADRVASNQTHLAVFTWLGTLNVLDFKSGQWTTHSTPRAFSGGVKLAADGYLVGMVGPYWVYGSADLGKSWKRMDVWLRMTEPHFFDRHRGVLLAPEADLMGGSKPYMVRTTSDGGMSWKTGGTVEGWMGAVAVVPLEPFGVNAAGSLMYSVNPEGELRVSTDGGRTWR